MNKKFLVLLICLILISNWYTNNKSISKIDKSPQKIVEVVKPEQPKPVVPKVDTPEIDHRIIYSNYTETLSLSQKLNKNIVLIFSAEWCPYCVDLKKNISSYTYPSNSIICILDIDSNRDLAKKFKIKSLPTSLVISNTETEIYRMIGYNKLEYKLWLAKQ